MILRYESYKPSGIPWVGDIPSHWGIKKNKFLLTERKALVGKDAPKFKLLSLTLQGVILRDMENPKGKFPAEFDTYKQVAPNDLIFCLFDVEETPRTVGLAKHYGMITGAYTVTHCNQHVSSAFLYYFYLSLDEGKQLRSLYTGLRNVISRDSFFSLAIPFPPREEQDCIVAFLDQKIREIDAAIAKKERLIDLLHEQKEILITTAVTQGLNSGVPMKICDIVGIPKIPTHWQVVSNRRIFREKARKYRGESLPPLSLSQKSGLIPTDEMEERSLKTSSFEHFRICRKDDLVLNRFKAHLGVFFAAKQDGVITFHYGIYTPESNVSSKYFELLFHTRSYCGIYAGASNGMTVGLQNLSNQAFYDIKSILPPHEEQLAIVKEVELLESKYQLLIASIEKECNELSALKKVTIASAVLGKIKVS